MRMLGKVQSELPHALPGTDPIIRPQFGPGSKQCACVGVGGVTLGGSPQCCTGMRCRTLQRQQVDVLVGMV